MCRQPWRLVGDACAGDQGEDCVEEMKEIAECRGVRGGRQPQSRVLRAKSDTSNPPRQGEGGEASDPRAVGLRDRGRAAQPALEERDGVTAYGETQAVRRRAPAHVSEEVEVGYSIDPPIGYRAVHHISGDVMCHSNAPNKREGLRGQNQTLPKKGAAGKQPRKDWAIKRDIKADKNRIKLTYRIKPRNRKYQEWWRKEGKEKRRRRRKLTEIRSHEGHTEPTRTRGHEPKAEFDSTKGYPGEGPTQERLKVATLNVAGLNDTTNQKMGGLLRWANEIQLDILCIQEHNAPKERLTEWSALAWRAGFCITMGVATRVSARPPPVGFVLGYV